VDDLEGGDLRVDSRVDDLEGGDLRVDSKVDDLEGGDLRVDSRVDDLEGGDLRVDSRVDDLEGGDLRVDSRVDDLEGGDLRADDLIGLRVPLFSCTCASKYGSLTSEEGLQRHTYFLGYFANCASVAYVAGHLDALHSCIHLRI